MRQVGAIVARFPGPVRLHVTRRRKLAIFAIAGAVTVLFAWLLIRTPLTWWEATFVWIAILLFGWLAVGAAILLCKPSGWCLTLDADGFETLNLLFFLSVRMHWRDVGEFRVRYVPGTSYVLAGRKVATFKILGAPFGARGSRILPDSYGLSEDDLVWLMNEWRARALARSCAQQNE